MKEILGIAAVSAALGFGVFLGGWLYRGTLKYYAKLGRPAKLGNDWYYIVPEYKHLEMMSAEYRRHLQRVQKQSGKRK